MIPATPSIQNLQQIVAELANRSELTDRRLGLVKLVDAAVKHLLPLIDSHTSRERTTAPSSGFIDLNHISQMMAGGAADRTPVSRSEDPRQPVLRILTLLVEANQLLAGAGDPSTLDQQTIMVADSLRELLSRETVRLSSAQQQSRDGANRLSQEQHQLLQELARRNQDLETQHSTESESIHRLQEQSVLLRQQVEELSRQRSESEQEVQELQRQYDELVSQAGQGRHLREEITRLIAEIAEQERTEAQAQAELRSLRQRHEVTTRLVQSLETQTRQSELSARLQEMWNLLPDDAFDLCARISDQDIQPATNAGTSA